MIFMYHVLDYSYNETLEIKYIQYRKLPTMIAILSLIYIYISLLSSTLYDTNIPL